MLEQKWTYQVGQQLTAQLVLQMRDFHPGIRDRNLFKEQELLIRDGVNLQTQGLNWEYLCKQGC